MSGACASTELSVGLRSESRSAFAFAAVLSLLVTAVALCINRVHNGDLYLLLASGRFISEHGFVWHDPFPTIAHGQPWANQQWLSELAFYRLDRLIGMTGLTVVYALVLGLSLFLLLWHCRRKGVLVLVAGAALYIPALCAIVHPRAAGFTLLSFSLLVVLLLHGLAAPGRLKWVLLAVPGLFLLWANLHGGLVAGLFLLAVVASGLGVDRLRRLPSVVSGRRIAALVAVGATAVLATLATPLGADIWTYLLSFRNPALSLGTKEWTPGVQSTAAMLYLAVAGGFAAWLWVRLPRPRPLTPPLVVCGFLLASAYSLRNLIFVAPAIFFLIAHSADRPRQAHLRPALWAGAAAVAAVLLWAVVLGPARDARYLRSSPAEYAAMHPPAQGRIAALAGVSSYLLWRYPGTPVVIDGWLEHFSPAALRANYGAVRARPGFAPDTARWGIGAVITRHPEAVAGLQAQGFVVKHRAPEGIYLVREVH